MKSTTKIFGCIADPIDHVKAPTLFSKEFSKRNVDAVMIPINATKENLHNVIIGLKNIKNFLGLTVTIPHKVDIINMCDELELEATEVGAVNWIKFENNKVIGNNFDGSGFIKGLLKSKVSLNDKSVCIFGAGGAGMAIAFALAKYNLKHLKIVNRDLLKGISLLKQLKNSFPSKHISVESLNEYNISNFDIVINATSLGLKENVQMPFDPNKVNNNCLIADIIMDPEETALIQQARKLNKKVHLGKNMLENQIDLVGMYFKLW